MCLAERRTLPAGLFGQERSIMATSAPATTKTAGAPKTMTAPRKRAAAPARGGLPLQFRYYAVMKPQRVYALVVEMPKKKGGEIKGGGPVVLRPIIPGALVGPPEQRFDTSEAGNQITFHVTPLARGRLPRARVEVFAAGQAPQEILLPMKAKTQRLTWLLLILAVLVPWFLIKITLGDWKPEATDSSGKPRDPALVLGDRVWATLHNDITRIPLFNAPTGKGEDWTKDAGGKDLGQEAMAEKDRKEFTIAGRIADGFEVVYKGLEEGVRANRWAVAAGVILALLAFVSWSFHRPRSARVRQRLELASAETAGEPPVLQPL
jgi:hypothetical protein